MTRRKITFNAASLGNVEIAGRTALYRLYDASERLLYLGISMNLDQRWDTHSREKLWWHLVAQKHVEWFATRVEALVAEEKAERVEKPRFGDTHRLNGGWVRHARKTDPEMEQGITDLAATLRSALAAGQHKPGEPLPEVRTLAEAHGVSIAMVRSALTMLTSERLLHFLGASYVVRSTRAEGSANG